MELTLFPESYRPELSAFPEPLLALLAAELQAGNELTEVGAGFPAPPVGCCAKLARDVTTHPTTDAGDLRYREWPNWTYTSGFTDDRGHFFVLNPPPPPPPEPDMDAIRAAHAAPHVYAVPTPPETPEPEPQPGPPSENLVQRFRNSMVIDYERWHDGIGYDLDALRRSTGEDRAAMEAMVLNRGAADWRDIEALAILDTEEARAVLRSVLNTDSHEARIAAIRYSPHLFTAAERTRVVIVALRETTFGAGLSQALDQAAEAQNPEVVDALLWASIERPGEIAVHCAATAEYVLGKASERFDMRRRALYLRFNTPDRAERITAFRDLCEGLGLDPQPYLR